MLGGLGVAPYEQLGYCFSPDGVKFDHDKYSAVNAMKTHNVIVMAPVKVTAFLIVFMLRPPSYLSQSLGS
jgi:hypothetical protein